MSEQFQESEICSSLSASTAVCFCVGNLGLVSPILACEMPSGVLNIFHFPLFKIGVIILNSGLDVASMVKIEETTPQFSFLCVWSIPYLLILQYWWVKGRNMVHFQISTKSSLKTLLYYKPVLKLHFMCIKSLGKNICGGLGTLWLL